MLTPEPCSGLINEIAASPLSLGRAAVQGIAVTSPSCWSTGRVLRSCLYKLQSVVTRLRIKELMRHTVKILWALKGSNSFKFSRTLSYAVFLGLCHWNVMRVCKSVNLCKVKTSPSYPEPQPFGDERWVRFQQLWPQFFQLQQHDQSRALWGHFSLEGNSRGQGHRHKCLAFEAAPGATKVQKQTGKTSAFQCSERKLPIRASGIAEPGGCRSSRLAEVPSGRQAVCLGPAESGVAVCGAVTVSCLTTRARLQGLRAASRQCQGQGKESTECWLLFLLLFRRSDQK